jgi:hypothetical protein
MNGTDDDDPIWLDEYANELDSLNDEDRSGSEQAYEDDNLSNASEETLFEQTGNGADTDVPQTWPDYERSPEPFDDNPANDDGAEPDCSGPGNGTITAAARFLEQTWGRLCECDSGADVSERVKEEEGEEEPLSLPEMVDFWKNCKIPDSLSSPRMDKRCHGEMETDWFKALSGGSDQPPKLSFEKSQVETGVERTWDVDSLIVPAHCLSIHKGLNFAYCPKFSRQLTSKLHVIINNCALHRTSHLRLGQGYRSPDMGIYIFFPEMHLKSAKSTTFLSSDQQEVWIDKIFLPALRRVCPQDVLQHHPKSWKEASSKAWARSKESPWESQVKYAMDIHDHIPKQYLEPLWADICRHLRRRRLPSSIKPFRNAFLVINAKDLKLQTKASTLQACRGNFIADIQDQLNWDKADLSQTWIDIGVEDTPSEPDVQLLHKRPCLQHWIGGMKYNATAPLLSSRIYNWNFTRDAAGATVDLTISNTLSRGGLAYAQRYQLGKHIFATPAKDHKLFGSPAFEGLGYTADRLQAWAAANNGSYKGSGEKRLEALQRAFVASKGRADDALDSAYDSSFGIREEYRMSWSLFLAVEPAQSAPAGSHRHYWAVKSSDVHSFIRWEANRWIATVEALRAGVQASTKGQCVTAQNEHQRAGMLSAVLRCLRSSIGGRDVRETSALYRRTYLNRQQEEMQGLAIEDSLNVSGLGWLPTNLFDWDILGLGEVALQTTALTRNGMKDVHPKWQAVEAAGARYDVVQNMEIRLKEAIAESNHDLIYNTILTMNHMVYRQFAKEVLGRAAAVAKEGYDSDDEEEDDEDLLDGGHGLSYSIVKDATRINPFIARPQTDMKNYLARLQTLFDWDDGYKRTKWDKKGFRDLAKIFYNQILRQVDQETADKWRRRLGHRALRHIWIIPYYDRVNLFLYTDRDSLGRRMMKWTAGVHRDLVSQDLFWYEDVKSQIRSNPARWRREDLWSCHNQNTLTTATKTFVPGRPFPIPPPPQD